MDFASRGPRCGGSRFLRGGIRTVLYSRAGFGMGRCNIQYCRLGRGILSVCAMWRCSSRRVIELGRFIRLLALAAPRGITARRLFRNLVWRFCFFAKQNASKRLGSSIHSFCWKRRLGAESLERPDPTLAILEQGTSRASHPTVGRQGICGRFKCRIARIV